MSATCATKSVSATTRSTAAVTSKATAEWAETIPIQVTETFTCSVTFMKQLAAIAISTLTYLKQIFPEESYKSEIFEGIELKILKTKCEDEAAQYISTAITQSYAALEKKYLDKLVLCLYDGKCHVDNLTEAHCFEFTYSAAGVDMDMRSSGRGGDATRAGLHRADTRSAKHFQNIRLSTMKLVDNCILVSQTPLKQTKESYDISLRLYYNDAAPAGYQAPGFELAPAGADPLAGALQHCAGVELGRVHTPFHRLVAHFYTRDMPSSHEANPSSNAPMMTPTENDMGSDQENDNVGDRDHENDNAGGCEQENPPIHFHRGDADVGADGAQAPGERCACGARPAADDPDLITCEYCGASQHAVCYGFMPRSAARAHYCCVRCSDVEPGRPPTCPHLAHLRLSKKRQMMCLVRRTLVWLHARARPVTARSLEARLQLPRSLAHKLLRYLQEAGVLRGDTHRLDSSHEINREKLRTTMSTHFQPDENIIVERVLVESLTREGAEEPDLVGDVLGPEEQLSLKNATTMGRIIQHTPPDDVPEDSTLKQYKQAIFSTDKHTDEELPLSGSHNPVKNIRKGEKTVTKRKMDDPSIHDPSKKLLKSRLSTKKSKVMT